MSGLVHMGRVIIFRIQTRESHLIVKGDITYHAIATVSVCC